MCHLTDLLDKATHPYPWRFEPHLVPEKGSGSELGPWHFEPPLVPDKDLGASARRGGASAHTAAPDKRIAQG